MTSLRQLAARLGDGLNDPDRAAGSTGLRWGWGAVRTLWGLLRLRRLTYLWWSPGAQLWLHRWPEGRVADPRWWRSAHAWATEGGLYDMHDLLWRQYTPQPGDTVVDVGAGHGGETLYLAGMVGPTGRVLAIEAAPRPFRRLADVVRRNGWSQVLLEQVAVSDRPGTVSISDGGNWLEGNIFDGKGSAEVPAVTLDELCERHGITRVDWLKMNIEGAEREAVRGLERMAPQVRHLTIACHDFLGTEWGRSKDAVSAWLTSHGFEVTEHGPGPEWAQCYLYARRA